jgi:5-enolpyruvylshikimate-3-phosphate synthase
VRAAQCTCYSSAMPPQTVMVRPAPRVRGDVRPRVIEPLSTRDHTERTLEAFGAVVAAAVSYPEFFSVLESLRA